MRGPETASPSLTIRRSITCECDQHLHFSAEVSRSPNSCTDYCNKVDALPTFARRGDLWVP